MGVETRLVLFAPDSATGMAAARAAFDRVAELDSLMSDYRVDSELNAVNEAAGAAAVPISGDLVRVLETALRIAGQSDGAFDVTTGPVVILWREARRTGQVPEPSALSAARELVDWRRVRLGVESRTVRLETPGMRLDLGGIAKGYAADAARAALAAHGITRCLVEIGGELALGDAPPGRPGWSIAIGADSASREPRILANTAVATSGDAEQYTVIGDVRYSHVIEPATGAGSTRGISATVIGPDGAVADALATAVTLLDRAAGERLMRAWPEYSFVVERPGA